MAQIDALFNELIKSEGSDLHLEQGQRPRMRINGKLTDCEKEPVLTQDYLCGILKEICSKQNWQKLELKGDLDFAYALDNGARFRANYFKFFFGTILDINNILSFPFSFLFVLKKSVFSL